MNTMSNFAYLINLEKTLDPIIESKIKKIQDKQKKKIANTEIEPEIFKEGLHDLGVTHNKYNHAYLSLNISNKELGSIVGIHNFIFLQNVNISYNYLTSLEHLSYLKHLTKLDASHNKISELFDFHPPHSLEYADYSYNEISQIQNVSKHKYLKVLLLTNNEIRKIENVNQNAYLEVLDLSNNHIEFIENITSLPLMKLNLMSNKIKTITGLEESELLLELNLSRNQITKLKGLQRLYNLRYLYLSSNNISRAKQVAYISELPFLNDLDLCHNDVQNRKYYRSQILFYLPKLRRLDGMNISNVEKVKADILFDSDLDNRKEIFGNYLQEEQFVDRRLFVAQQIDPESDSEEEEEREGFNSSKLTLSSIKKTKVGLYEDTDEGLGNKDRISHITY